MKNRFSKIISAVLIAALLLAAAACAPKDAGTDNTTAAANDGVIKAAASYKATLTAQIITAFPDAFVTGMNHYGWTAASRLYNGENLALSPASLELAILMTRTGAIGATADEMKAALSMSALYEFTFDTSMKKTMQTLGMNLAFDPERADFDGLTVSDNSLCISDILHACRIRVDEKGTEVSAVTEPIMTSASASLDDDLKTFTADRPFLFAIYDETDNTILFLGAVGQL